LSDLCSGSGVGFSRLQRDQSLTPDQPGNVQARSSGHLRDYASWHSFALFFIIGKILNIIIVFQVSISGAAGVKGFLSRRDFNYTRNIGECEDVLF
jgi:hypothetical protein